MAVRRSIRAGAGVERRAGVRSEGGCFLFVRWLGGGEHGRQLGPRDTAEWERPCNGASAE